MLTATVSVPKANAADSAVILMYHRFDDSTYPSTNIRLDQFEAHLEHLKAGGYSVLPVPHIIAALRAGNPLPDRTIGITIDDAYVSIYEEAWPRLKEAGIPFTLFVATGAVDAGTAGIMTWDQIRELAAAGVTIGNHGTNHGHLWQFDAGAIRADIANAQARIESEVEVSPSLFAYPYGEFDLTVRRSAADAGFEAAFGQHSGAIFGGSDFFALSRFALNEHFGDIDRFALVAATLPLPVADLTPANPVVGANNPPAVGFTVTDILHEIGALACFASHQGTAVIEQLGPSRVEIRLDQPLPPGRSRINCTMPGPDGRWRWFGTQFIVPGS